MTRSPFRLPLAEFFAVVGVIFGAWLIHHTFTPAADTPNYILVSIGVLDILLCFGLLGYLLRGRLREVHALPRSWLVAAVVLIACFLGWIAALFVDSDRLLARFRSLSRAGSNVSHAGSLAHDLLPLLGRHQHGRGHSLGGPATRNGHGQRARAHVVR